METYYAPHASIFAKINSPLQLPALGDEQDWEVEMADPTKIAIMFALLNSRSLNLEGRSAMTLLLMWSINEASEYKQYAESLRNLLTEDSQVRDRMRFYWSRRPQTLQGSVLEALL